MRVLIIEDNEYHAKRVKGCLENIFVDTNVAILKTEHEVLTAIDQIATENPHVIILDIILPWCDVSPDMPELPGGYEKEGPYRAGVRCLKAFLSHTTLQHVPIIVHSVVDGDALNGLLDKVPPNVIFLSKPLEPEKMAETIESFLLSLQPKRRPTTAKNSLIDASEIKLGTKGFNLDLKKLLKRKN